MFTLKSTLQTAKSDCGRFKVRLFIYFPLIFQNAAGFITFFIIINFFLTTKQHNVRSSTLK